MTLVSDIRKTVTDTTPVYAAVGVTDLAVEKVREIRAAAVAARVRAEAVRSALDVTTLQDEAVKRAEKVAGQAQQLPAFALNQTLEVAGKAQETYAELAVRGEKLVNRLRTQKATQDLLAQAGSTVSLGKGAVTTVRKAVIQTERAAKATVTTGRHQADVVAGTVRKSVKGEAKATAGTVRKSVQGEAKATAGTVRKSAAATRTSAKRTATTAKKSTASARRATKSAATSATKTAAAAVHAVEAASPKVGD